MTLWGVIRKQLEMRYYRYAVPSDPKETVDIFNWCLEVVMGWIRANKLKLNPDKREGRI